MNMTVLFKKCTYGLLLIATTIIGGINFCSAGNYNYSGNVVLSNGTCNTNNNYCQFNYNLSIPVDDIVNFNTNRASCVLSNFSSSLNSNRTNAIKFYYLTKQNGRIQTMSSSSQTLTVGNTINYDSTDRVGVPVYIAFQLYTIDGINELSFDFNCNFTGYNIINQTDLSTCQSDLSTCQSDLNTCQNSSSSCSPSGQCTINNKLTENILYSGSVSLGSSSYSNIFNYGNNGAGTYCVKLTSSSPQTLTFGFANGGTTAPTNLYQLYNDQYGNRVCLYGNKAYFNAKLNSSSNTVSYEIYKLTDLLSDDIPCTQQNCPTCPTCEEQYTSAECQTEYNLMPINDIDMTYCTSNGLCPIPEGTGELQWSSLRINNIQHLGNANIYIEIPEEIERDYNYDEDDTEIEIIGYGYDQAKMQSIVNTQFTPPTSEDLTNAIGKIADFLPLLAIMLLIVYAWWLIKKVF